VIKCSSEELARRFARERSAFYGWSIFGKAWYVGTREQLGKIGCVGVKS
jgi:hypothetical protein